MYILKSHCGNSGNLTIYNSRIEAQKLLEAWERIANGRYPVTLQRVPKMVALHEYANFLVDNIREKQARCKDEGIYIALNHVLCLLFKLQDITSNNKRNSLMD